MYPNKIDLGNIKIGIECDTKRLETAMICTPGNELNLLNPNNFREYLFEDLVQKEKFIKEHKRLIRKLRDNNVRLIDYRFILKKMKLNPDIIGKFPNITYINDHGKMIGNNLLLGNSGKTCRIPEFQLARNILGSMTFGSSKFTTIDKINPPSILEGGSLILIDEKTLVVGISDRLNEIAANFLVNDFLSNNILEEVILVYLPINDIFRHLSKCFNLLSADLAMIFEKAVDRFPSIKITKNGEKTRKDLVIFSEYLKEKGFNLIEINENEMFKFGTDFLYLGPRKIIVYKNTYESRTIDRLTRREFVKIIEIEGGELFRGRGGPNSFILPLTRR